MHVAVRAQQDCQRAATRWVQGWQGAPNAALSWAAESSTTTAAVCCFGLPFPLAVCHSHQAMPHRRTFMSASSVASMNSSKRLRLAEPSHKKLFATSYSAHVSNESGALDFCGVPQSSDSKADQIQCKRLIKACTGAAAMLQLGQ